MPVILVTKVPRSLEPDERVCFIEGSTCSDFPTLDVATKLEKAFGAIYDRWRSIALSLQKQKTAELAHMPTLSTYSSDFGLMLAWVEIIKELQADIQETTVVCPDPWLYRCLASISGVASGSPPSLILPILKLRARGFLARCRVVIRCLRSLWRTAHQRRTCGVSGKWLLVYGHPDSNAEGQDAYFGDLMRKLTDLQRMMHTDCSASYALQLGEDGRTFSMHAWGCYFRAFTLLFTRWRANTVAFDPASEWLIRRAEALEGSGGSAAMTRWQIICQSRWLSMAQPHTIAWPWESHPWERALCKSSKALNVRTFGYQHTVVGEHMYNQGADSSIDSLGALPDLILLNGPAYRKDLEKRGVPDGLMKQAGSFRINMRNLPKYDPAGPVFVALSNNPKFAEQMVAATRPLAGPTMPFLVKDHPLCPYRISQSDNFSYTSLPISDLPPIRALVYCTGTTGLEGLLSGVPTVRFIPEGGIALNTLPDGLQPISVSRDDLNEALKNNQGKANHATDELFPPPNYEMWATLMNQDKVFAQK